MKTFIADICMHSCESDMRDDQEISRCRVVLKENSLQKRGSKITWMSFQNLDLFSSQTALMQISKHLVERINYVDFFAVRSKRVPRSNISGMRLVAIPLRTCPVVMNASISCFH